MCLDIQDTDDEEDHRHCEHAPKVDGSATEVWHENEPSNESTEECHSCPTGVQTVGRGSVKTNLLEKVRRVVSECGSGEDLTSEAHTSNFCSSTLHALEAVPVRRAG